MELKKREEIINSFDRCVNGPCSRATCSRFDSDETVGHRFCHRKIYLDALALIKELTEEIKDLEADYDRVYEQAEADIHGNMADGGTSCHWCMDKTKADTVKMMQSKLTDMSEFMLRADHNGAMYYVDHAAWVEEIAKELLEENK